MILTQKEDPEKKRIHSSNFPYKKGALLSRFHPMRYPSPRPSASPASKPVSTLSSPTVSPGFILYFCGGPGEGGGWGHGDKSSKRGMHVEEV